MRLLVCLLLAGACGLGLYAWRQKTPVSPQETPPVQEPPASPLAEVPAKPSTLQAPAPPRPAEGWPSETRPGPEECATLDFGGGVQILWRRGGRELTGRLNGQEIWALETDFPAADVRKGNTPQEAVLSAVDGLASLRLDARSGKVLSVARLGGVPAVQAPAAEVEALLKQAKAAYAAALRHPGAQAKAASREGVRALLETSERLSKLGRQTEAFKVWAAAKKLQKALDPVPVATPLRPTPPPQPPPDGEDLDF